MPDKILKETESKMKHTIDALIKEFASVRSGRANPKMLDKVNVNYYGAETPITQIASVSVPEATQIYIKPYDKNSLGDVEKAIFAANLGVTPANDGIGIRLSLPPMTEENRKEAAKQVHKMAESDKVSIRNVRRDAISKYKKMEKASEISEDDLRYYEDEVQKLTDKYIDKIDELAEAKQKEIMHV